MISVGVVVVSHSRALAEAAVELAMEMVHENSPRVVVAAGTADGGMGTDAMAVQGAIVEADQGMGVVVLTDLGSAILSSEMALEFLDDSSRVRIVPAPFVEGLVAAVVQASTGAPLEAVAAEASRALQPKQSAIPTSAPAVSPPASGGLLAEREVANPAGMHARPAARIVAEAAKFDAAIRIAGPDGHFANASSPIALASLRAAYGDLLKIETSGPEARAALDALVFLVEKGFGELNDSAQASPPPPTTGHRHAPQGVSPGRVVGPAYLLVQPRMVPPEVPPISLVDVPAETQLLRSTVQAVAQDYERRAEQTDNRDIANILRATAVLARDEVLMETAIQLMTDTLAGAATAFWHSVNQAAETLLMAGRRMAERVTDLHDIRNRVVSHLLGEPVPGLPNPGVPYVLVAHDVAASDASTLNSKDCLAIVTREGGRTSHTSILARGMGIPAVVGFEDIATITAGTTVLVDGTTGEVIVAPTPQEYASARTTVAPLRPLLKPGNLADGTPMPLLANVGTPKGAKVARDAAAEGVGLFRTEVCFLERVEEPSVEEQAELYAQVLRHFDGKPVVIRTLDAGSDKPIPFLAMPAEENPALGVRGYRTSFLQPDVLRRQLEAIGHAVRMARAHVSVMAPMVSTPQEASDFVDLAREVGLERVGIMVETPSAALMAPNLLEIADFVSIGTNDLAQYTMAADRLSASLTDLQEPWHPAVLSLMRMVGAAGSQAGKPVGVCGESAADPELAPVLVGLGASSLSMSARSMQAVAEALAKHPMDVCRRAAEAACAATSPGQARAAAAEALQVG